MELEFYKEKLIKKIQSLKDKDCDTEWNQALQTVILEIKENEIEKES